MAGKILPCLVVLQIWISTVNSQFGLLGGGLGEGGLGEGGLGGGLGGLLGGGLGGGNGGLLGGGLGGGNGLFGGPGGVGGNGFGGFGGFMGGFRQYFRSSRLNRAVRNIVHPDARPTRAMLDIAYRHRGPPQTPAEGREYIPHFTQLAFDMGVQHPNPNITGIPTYKQMEQLMMERARAHQTKQNPTGSSSGNAGSSGNSGSASNSGQVGNFGPSGSSGTAGNSGPVGNSGSVTQESWLGGNSGSWTSGNLQTSNSGQVGNSGPSGSSGAAGNSGLVGNSSSVTQESWLGGNSGSWTPGNSQTEYGHVGTGTAANNPLSDALLLQILMMSNNPNNNMEL